MLRLFMFAKKVITITGNTKIGGAFIRFLIRLGIWLPVIDYFRSKKIKHTSPSHKLKDIQAFYAANTNRINKIKSWLADDVSKVCFEKIINFRCSNNFHDFPSKLECKRSTQYFYNEFFRYENEIFIDCGAYDGNFYI